MNKPHDWITAMQKAAKDKAAITKKMNLIAGARLPLPGHNHHREQVLRTEFAAFLKPADLAEIIWIIDMARCQAAIEVLSAQLAGVRMRQLKDAHEKLTIYKVADPRGRRSEPDMAALMAQAQLDLYAEQHFAPLDNKSLLDKPGFAELLAAADRKEIEEVRILQQALHHETRERDRLFNQLKRRRSQDLRDALLINEEKRQAALFAIIMAQAAADGCDDLPATGASSLPARNAG